MPWTNTYPSLPFSEDTTSRDAALAMVPKADAQRKRVLDYITSMGVWGATQKDAKLALGIDRASLAPRFFELELSCQIVKTNHRREGCRIYARPWITVVKP